MSWFELVGAFSGNLHFVAMIMFIVAVGLTLACGVLAIISSQEYHEIEFVSLAKSFGSMSIFLGLLMCAPTSRMMQEFSNEVDALKSENEVIKTPPAIGQVDKQGIPYSIKAESK